MCDVYDDVLQIDTRGGWGWKGATPQRGDWTPDPWKEHSVGSEYCPPLNLTDMITDRLRHPAESGTIAF